MIKSIELKTIEDFEKIKKGDFLAVEWNERENFYKNKQKRFAVYEIHSVIIRTKEIVLQSKMNVYFNYEMYLKGKSGVLHVTKIDSMVKL